MSELTPEEQKFFETGGNIPETEVKNDETSAVHTPAPAEEPKHEQAQDKPEKTVPYGALHEERQLRKQAQEQLRQYDEKIKSFETLQNELKDWRQQQQKQKELEAAQQDPLTYTAKKADEAIQRVNQFEQQQKQSIDQQNQQTEFLRTVNAQVMAYTKEQPSYPQALQYLVEHRMREYEALGINDPAERQALFDNEAINIAQHAMARGINPAQAVWNMAQVRGFNMAPAATPETKVSAADAKLATIAKGQQTAKTVGAGGATPEAGLSLTDIEKMSDKEFDQLWSDMAKGA